MKLVLMSLVSALLTTAAYAIPAIGDMANYNFAITQQGQNITGTLEQTITSMNSGLYNVQSTYNVNGQSQVQNDQKKAEDLVSDAMINNILTNCASSGGQLASITVPAGAFNTCALPINDGEKTGTIWIGQVAFGVVKMDTTTTAGDKTYVELVSFKLGQ